MMKEAGQTPIEKLNIPLHERPEIQHLGRDRNIAPEDLERLTALASSMTKQHLMQFHNTINGKSMYIKEKLIEELESERAGEMRQIQRTEKNPGGSDPDIRKRQQEQARAAMEWYELMLALIKKYDGPTAFAIQRKLEDLPRTLFRNWMDY